MTKGKYLIAGPCSAESREQVLQAAQGISSIPGIQAFRAGVWKPRTRPGTFEGIGQPALEWLREVKSSTGLSVMTEVANAHHIESALKAGIDQLWIGARSTVNPFYVQEMAEALRGVKVPVWVKNPIHPELGLWLGAIERFEQAGVEAVHAIHRGFFSYESAPFRNEPKWELALELKRQHPEIKVICDPSHIAGKPSLLPEVCQTAMDLSLDGLMVETHPKPEEALSDKQQQITPAELRKLLEKLIYKTPDSNHPQFLKDLGKLRNEIDQIDKELLQVLAERMEKARQIGKFKLDHEVTIFQLERWFEILKSREGWGVEMGLAPQFVYELYQLIHKNSIRVQTDLRAKD